MIRRRHQPQCQLTFPQTPFDGTTRSSRDNDACVPSYRTWRSSRLLGPGKEAICGLKVQGFPGALQDGIGQVQLQQGHGHRGQEDGHQPQGDFDPHLSLQRP